MGETNISNIKLDKNIARNATPCNIKKGIKKVEFGLLILCIIKDIRIQRIIAIKKSLALIFFELVSPIRNNVSLIGNNSAPIFR